MKRQTFAIAASAAALLAGCGPQAPEAESADQAPTADELRALPLADADLIAGRETWLRTCATCHLTGLTGAPIIGDRAAWADRIAKGLDTLYDHALNGFIGPEYKEMPPKGGFAELSDDEVKQAVRFVTSVSR